jgi:VWFA-related protein
MSTIRAALIVGVILGCAFRSFAQPKAYPDSPRRLTQLSVAATDAKGQPVTDLRLADIRLRDDGKPYPLVFFRFNGVRREIASPAAGAFINRSGITPTVILFDRWNEHLITAAESWGDIDNTILHMESVDRLYIYVLTNKGDLYAVHALPPPDADPITISPPSPAQLRAKLDEAVQKLSGFRNIDVFDPILRANATVQALAAIGTQMSIIAGRKNLVWVTHGFPLQLFIDGQPIDFASAVRKLSVAATQADLQIYTVDQSAQGAGADMLGQSRATLQMFAALTGGRWLPSGNTELGLAEALADGRGAYRLAYYTPYRENDHKEHKIRLESSRKGVRLQTREGYFGDTPEADPAMLEQALLNPAPHSPFDATDVGLRVAFSRAASGDATHFNIRVNPAEVLLDHAADKYLGQFTVMLALYGADFVKTLPTVRVDIQLTEDQFKRAATDGIVIPQDVPVGPEVVKVRVIVFDNGLHSLGSVTFPME